MEPISPCFSDPRPLLTKFIPCSSKKFNGIRSAHILAIGVLLHHNQSDTANHNIAVTFHQEVTPARVKGQDNQYQVNLFSVADLFRGMELLNYCEQDIESVELWCQPVSRRCFGIAGLQDVERCAENHGITSRPKFMIQRWVEFEDKLCPFHDPLYPMCASSAVLNLYFVINTKKDTSFDFIPLQVRMNYAMVSGSTREQLHQAFVPPITGDDITHHIKNRSDIRTSIREFDHQEMHEEWQVLPPEQRLYAQHIVNLCEAKLKMQ